MPPVNNPLHQVYNRWERFLNDVSKTFGGDRELGELSNKLAEVKEKAFADGVLTEAEVDQIYAKMELIAKAYEKVAADRGLPLDRTLPTSKKTFEIAGEGAQIHFQTFAGEGITKGELGGVVGELLKGIRGNDSQAIERAARNAAFDIATSQTPEVAKSKVNLLRQALSHIPDRDKQLDALNAVGAKLDKLQLGGRKSIGKAQFDQVAFPAPKPVSVHKVELPNEVKGTNNLFPNKPIPGWEAEVARATKAGFDDLSRAGKLFVDDDTRFPRGSTKTVAVKLDMNLGREGTPSVSDPASTAATITELLERSAAKGKTVHLNVGDSSGGENIPLGRTSMDIMRDTGNYHMTLKAGLAFAAKNGPDKDAAVVALAKINAAEARGVYFGSKDDKVSRPADLVAVEKAAAPWVKCIDYDKEGWKSVTPDLPPHGMAAWGTKEFQISKPWAESDFRVHVARGLSTHTLAAWTGAQKGLIGLHGFGLRPADQSSDKAGQNAVDLFKLLGQSTGFMAMFARRQGVPSILSQIFAAGGADADKIKKTWDTVMSDTHAGAYFKSETRKLADELERKQKSGVHEVAIYEEMRDRTRAILAECDKKSPGFTQKMWDAAHEATEYAMKNLAREPFRQLIPAVSRDEQIGQRIGLLTHLPYQSDLVVQSQAKIGVGGGPDAYREVRDVGHVAVGLDEQSLDMIAWHEAKQSGNMFDLNFPLTAAVGFGHAPMHLDEIQRL